jgi:DNA-binding LacI/PurR family transcriptional regulator
MRAVGVVLPYAGRWYFAEILRGIEESLRSHGYDVVLHVLADQWRRRAFFSDLPVHRRVDALLVVGLRLDAAEAAVVRTLGMPVACVGEVVDGVHCELVDDVEAARVAVGHLLDLGHRRIGMIGGNPRQPTGGTQQRRWAGYRETLEAAGLRPRPEWERDGAFTAVHGERAMAELLGLAERPTGVVCQSDEMAFGALHALRRAGLRCPDDVSVIGIDDHELSATLDLTTVAQPVLAQGAGAARWLVAHLADPEVAEADVRVHPVRLVERASTGPAGAVPSQRSSG